MCEEKSRKMRVESKKVGREKVGKMTRRVTVVAAFKRV